MDRLRLKYSSSLRRLNIHNLSIQFVLLIGHLLQYTVVIDDNKKKSKRLESCYEPIYSASLGLTAYLDSSIPDAVGSLLVGCMLAAVSTLIIHSSVPALVGRSIEFDQLNKINAELESDSIIKSIHEVRGIDMGNNKVRYKVSSSLAIF